MSESLTFGHRLRMYRQRAGKSRAVLGGLVGRSPEWVKALESGRLLTPRLPMLIRLAEVLGVDDLAELTGDQSLPVATVTKASHDATPTVAEAMRLPVRHPEQPVDVAAFAGQVAQAWQLWHRSSQERTAVAAVLPDLLRTGQAAVRMAEGLERRRALAQLTQTYHLTQLFLAFQPAAELVWLAADRAMTAAQDADDPLAIASASWYYSHVYRFANQADAAEHLARQGLELLDPAGGAEQLARWGQLQLAVALASSTAGRAGDAWRHWDEASRAADTLGGGYTHPWLIFGRAAVDAYGVTLDADLFQLGSATRRIDRFDHTALPSRTRRSAYLIQASRAHYLRREHLATVHLLGMALRESAETTRHSTFARGVTLELMDGRGPVAGDARELALAIGVEQG